MVFIKNSAGCARSKIGCANFLKGCARSEIGCANYLKGSARIEIGCVNYSESRMMRITRIARMKFHKATKKKSCTMLCLYQEIF